MVFIHFKKTEMNQFRWETTTKISVEELIETLCLSKPSSSSKQPQDQDREARVGNRVACRLWYALLMQVH